MKVKIEIPTNCPSCNSVLETVNSQIFCRDKSCPAQSTKKVEAFVKKMRIKGLGPASISKLGFVQPIEIYETELDTYVEVLGEKIGQKVYDEIQNSRTTSFATFLSALSIPLIGDTASKKIGEVINSIEEIMHVESPLGEKATDNLLSYYEENYEVLFDLSSYFIFTQNKKQVVESRGKVCITGKLNDFSNRTKAKEFLEELGYTVTSTVSSQTNYLVDEEGKPSSKRKQAESLKIPIVSIVNLIN